MESQEALFQATEIAKVAFARAQREDAEINVQAAERSESPVLRSLARAYRMLQNPFG